MLRQVRFPGAVFIVHLQEASMLPGVDFDSWVVPALLLVLAGLLLLLLWAWRENRHLLQSLLLG